MSIINTIRENTEKYIKECNFIPNRKTEYNQPPIKYQVEVIDGLLAVGKHVDVVTIPVSLLSDDTPINMMSWKYDIGDVLNNLDMESFESIYFYMWFNVYNKDTKEEYSTIRCNKTRERTRLKSYQSLVPYDVLEDHNSAMEMN